MGIFIDHSIGLGSSCLLTELAILLFLLFLLFYILKCCTAKVNQIILKETSILIEVRAIKFQVVGKKPSNRQLVCF